jgi:hypothetical protein
LEITVGDGKEYKNEGTFFQVANESSKDLPRRSLQPVRQQFGDKGKLI